MAKAPQVSSLHRLEHELMNAFMLFVFQKHSLLERFAFQVVKMHLSSLSSHLSSFCRLPAAPFPICSSSFHPDERINRFIIQCLLSIITDIFIRRIGASLVEHLIKSLSSVNVEVICQIRRQKLP